MLLCNNINREPDADAEIQLSHTALGTGSSEPPDLIASIMRQETSSVLVGDHRF